MRANTMLRALLCLGLLAGAAVATGCGDEPAGPVTEVRITTSALSPDTADAFFVMGRDNTYLPFGGLGEIDAGPPPTASITFRNVAEGPYLLKMAGYDRDNIEVPNGTTRSPVFCEKESGQATVNVVGGAVNRAQIPSSLTAATCQHLYVDRYVANPSYEPDTFHPWYGSGDRENLVTVYIDNWGAATQLIIRLCDPSDPPSCASVPFGIFTSLPDISLAPWSNHPSWVDTLVGPTAATETDANGDYVFYLVAKPGAEPQTWKLTIVHPTAGDETITLRISNMNTVIVSAQ